MKIAIDVLPVAEKVKTGIGWYAYHLIHNLAKIDGENRYMLFNFTLRNFRSEFLEMKSVLPGRANFALRYGKLPGKITRGLAEKFLPAEIFLGNFDVLHIPYPSAVSVRRGKLIVTIHDLTCMINEEWYSAGDRSLTERRIREAVLRADGIITDSESTKRDIMKYFPVPSSHINVVYLGVEDVFRQCSGTDEGTKILSGYGIGKKYLLFTGTIEPRKNLVRVLGCFEKIKGRFKEYQLVIAGKKGWLYGDFFARLDKLPSDARKDVILTEYVPFKELPYLYGNAALLLYPSLYEGFGLPVLEAMACGTPVITSNVSSLPEVAGDAGVLVDPCNEEEIASAVERVLSDGELKESMRRKGLERVKNFSWEKTARETLKVYKQSCEG